MIKLMDKKIFTNLRSNSLFSRTYMAFDIIFILWKDLELILLHPKSTKLIR